ncbi:MAG: hypothetical protein U0L74_01315, partial [Paludibacteraceae bacterium]|nr:hypothetical protein [Paludibacteraceae bacterium]
LYVINFLKELFLYAVRPALRRKRRFPFAVAKVRAFFFSPNFFESFFQVFLTFIKQGLIFRGLRGRIFLSYPPRRPCLRTGTDASGLKI